MPFVFVKESKRVNNETSVDLWKWKGRKGMLGICTEHWCMYKYVQKTEKEGPTSASVDGQYDCNELHTTVYKDF